MPPSTYFARFIINEQLVGKGKVGAGLGIFIPVLTTKETLLKVKQTSWALVVRLKSFTPDGVIIETGYTTWNLDRTAAQS